MAVPSSEPGVSFCLYGLYSLQSPGGWQDLKPCCLCVLGVTVEGYKDPLELSDESDGTRKLMSIAPAIESVLNKGGVLIIDEIEKELHPMLVDFVVAKFQSKQSNPNGAQLIFTTHNTELMNMEILRKDQLYFADKSSEDGTSELYSISEFGTRTTDNIRKGYLLGKYGATPDIEIEEVE